MTLVHRAVGAEAYLGRPWHWQVMWSDDDDAYIATVAEIEGFAGFGGSRDEALADGREAFVAHVGAMLAAGLPIPEPTAARLAARRRIAYETADVTDIVAVV